MRWPARFALEATFIVLVAVVAALADLRPPATVIVMALALGLACLAELILSSARGARGGPELEAAPPPEGSGPAGADPGFAPDWLESAAVLGVYAPSAEHPEVLAEAPAAARRAPRRSRLPRRFATQSGRRMPPPVALPEPELELARVPVEPAVPMAEAEAAVTEPVDGRVRAPVRSRLPRRFLTQSGRATALPARVLAQVGGGGEPPQEPPPREAESASFEPEAKPEAEPEQRPWSPLQSRWPWRRPGRAAPDRARRPAPSRREEQPELPAPQEEPEPERLCQTCGRPISLDRLRAIPYATRCIECKRAGRPEFADVPEVEDAVAAELLEPPAVSDTVTVTSRPAGAREWNVWELERLARRFGGHDASRDEEWGFLLVYLREFANPEGILPADFDALVRESFPELIAATEPV